VTETPRLGGGEYSCGKKLIKTAFEEARGKGAKGWDYHFLTLKCKGKKKLTCAPRIHMVGKEFWR